MVVRPASSTTAPGAGDRGGLGDPLLAGFVQLCGQLGRPLAEDEARRAAPFPGAGSDSATLVSLAERVGLEARVIRVSTRRLRDLSTPFLLIGAEPGRAWFVRGRADERLVLVDPLSGRVSVVRTEDAGRWSQEALTLAVAAAGEEAREGDLVRALLRRLRPVLWQIGVASVVINLLALATPLFMMTVYNKVINQAALVTLDVLAIGMMSLFAFELILRALRGYIAAHAGARLDAALGAEAVHHLLHQPLRAYDAMSAGQMLERWRQLDQIRQFLASNLPLLIVDLAFVGLFVAGLFWLSTPLALITCAAMPCFVVLSIVAQRRQAALTRTQSRANAAKSTALTESIAHAMTVKALGLEPEMERRFDPKLVESAWAGYRAATVGHAVGSFGQAVQQVTALAVIYVGARMIISGDLNIGALVAASILSARALAPLRQVAQAWTQLQQAREAFRRVRGFLREPGEASGGAGATPPVAGRLQLEAVTFRYATTKAPALAGVELDLSPGGTLAIVGAPGSGKSTLVKLLLGLERPSEGRILVDGADLATLPPAAWRAQLGVVPQQVQLFAGTIADNIAIGAGERSQARVVAAARFAGADAFIGRLPEGYETRLGERGGGLSQGQGQLIAIARALVRNPRVLILDEATSALDTEAEAYLLKNLQRAGSGRTLILVTHRPSVLEICERAIVLDQGRVTFAGPAREVAARMRQPAVRNPGRVSA